MRPLILAILAFSAGQAVPGSQPAEEPLAFEVRVYDGVRDATSEVAVRVYSAVSHEYPLKPLPNCATCVKVDEGFYDVQVVLLKDGQVRGVRWREQLLATPYPDEGRRHLEVINLQQGFGALRIRANTAADLDGFVVKVFSTRGAQTGEVGPPVRTGDSLLYVMPANPYDVVVRQGGGADKRLTDIEVVADGTRVITLPLP